VSEATLLVDGLRCGACSWLLEQALGQAPGIVDCSVNLASERASLRWDPSRTRLSELIDTADRFGFALQPFDASQREKQLREAARTHLRRLFVAGIGMMQVMMYAFPAYIAAEGDIEPAYAALMRWASLLLTLPVVLYSAAPIFRGAWKEWQRRSPGMDTPVAIGIGAAFAASVWATVTAEGEVWFDTVTMFVFLLLGARHLEWLARLRASRAIDTLAISRQKFPGSPASLDALCRRFGVDNSAREKHGALLDSEILAEVYLELIGGRQPDFALASQPAKNDASGSAQSDDWRPRPRPEPLSPRITADEAAAHAALVAKLGAAALWTKRA
jgi:copper chaperone CopZ